MSDSPKEDDEPRIYKALRRLIIHGPINQSEKIKPPEKPWWDAADEGEEDPLGPDFTGGLGR
jgi:hypothetical protein